MVIMAKAIANGYPFSAVVTRREIANALTHDYFPTYAGGAFECRAGIEVLDILHEEKLPEHADFIGNYLSTEFRRIAQKSKYIGDVRAKGMLIAVEFVKDKITKEPNVEALAHVFEKGKEAGVLFGKGGHKGHLVRLLGPLCLSHQSAKKAIGVFEEIIDGMN
jgi:4-aminobutyrate aminotransferase-like enzyme